MSNQEPVAVLAIVILFVSFTVAEPASVHFTAGLGSPDMSHYRVTDFGPHVSGVIGYVWPGGDQNVNGVLTGSTGDLIFAITATGDYRTDGTAEFGPKGSSPTRGWTGLMIAIPPSFIVPDASQVVSSFTNDYAGIYVSRVGPYDRYIPGWTLITVLAENGRDSVGLAVYYDRQTIQFTSANEWYYVRINGVTAPSVAGRYFFKMLLWGDSGYLDGPEGTANSACAFSKGSSCFSHPFPGEAPTQFLPTQNWPVMLVRGEIDPAVITGTIRYAGYNGTLYGLPVQEAGRVYAKMIVRLDPYTGRQRPDLPTVDGVGYFNATDEGHYELEGLAPGIYDLYASAAGYPQTLVKSDFTVLKGQSLSFDGYLQPGPVIHGNVFTKHQFGDEPWPESSYVKIELYDAPTLNHKPDSNAHLVSWSPLPCVAGGQNSFFGWVHAAQCGDPRLGSNVAFPWHEYVPGNNYFAGTNPSAFEYYQVSTGSTDNGQFDKLTQDPMGVGPPQHWFVEGSTSIPFHFEFGAKAEYGAPKDLDGMVPQVYATWVNGLTPGTYYVRAWVFRYVQSASDGSTFQESSFNITAKEWAGDVTLPIDLRLSSWLNETVHFHNTVNTITDDPIDTGAGMMAGTLVDATGQVWSYNQTLLGYHGLYSAGAYSGGFTYPSAFQSIWGVNLDSARVNANAIEIGQANIQFYGWNDTWGGENYGIPSGIYTPHVYVLGYLEQDAQEQASLTLSGNPTSISNHMNRGAGFNITVRSIDWQRPAVNRAWVWGNPAGYDFNGNRVGQEIDIGFYKDGVLADFLGDAPSAISTANTLRTSCLYQGGDPGAGCADITESSVEAAGGGWNPVVNGAPYQGNANGAFFGQEIRSPGFVGGYTTGLMLFETATNLFAPFSPSTWLLPTSHDSGQYDLRAYTYGYIQTKTPSAYASVGQVADVTLNLIIGVNVTLDILFNREHIITPTSANMSARIRLFDDFNRLAAEWMSSEGTYLASPGMAEAADGTNQYPFGPVLKGNSEVAALQPKPKALNTYNFLPSGVTTLHVLLAGLPQVPPFGQGAYWGVPKAGYTGYGALGFPGFGGPYFGDPIFTYQLRSYASGWGRSDACNFELDCYVNPGVNWNASGYFPNAGISGAPDYQGGWTVEVDFVNWYASSNYNPPVVGLLLGESYHIIPGTTAKSGLSLAEDAALSPTYTGHSLMANHLGPYSQQGIQISNAHDSGEASAILEVDSNGLLTSSAITFNLSNQLRLLSSVTDAYPSIPL